MESWDFELSSEEEGNFKTEKLPSEKIVRIKELITKEQSKALDYDYSRFLLQERLPFTLGPKLAGFTQELLNTYSKDILQQYSTSRYKMTRVAQSISSFLKAEIFSYLQTSPFSLSVDTSSDINGQSFLAVCAKFLEPGNMEKPTTKLISILPIGESSTGESLMELMMNHILAEESIQKNFMGIVSDDGPNMTGKKPRHLLSTATKVSSYTSYQRS